MMSTETMIFGWHPVAEALDAGKDLQKILMLQGVRNEKFHLVTQLAKEQQIPVQFVPQQKLDRLTKKNHQGVIAFGSPITFANLENLTASLYEAGEMPKFLACDEITDVRNFGAMCRTAECFGYHGVIIPSRGMAPINDEAVKSSSGALLRIPVCRVGSWSSMIKFLKNSGISVIGLTEKGASDIASHEFTTPLCIVMGNEETGLSEDSLRLCDHLLRIPMIGSTSSLNVAAATAIALYMSTTGDN